MGGFVSQQARDASVRRLGQRLLAAAAVSPTLIGRCNSIGMPSEMRSVRPPALALLSTLVRDMRRCREELVSTAVAVSQQAGDLSEEAPEASWKTERQPLIVGCLGVMGLLIGAPGFPSTTSSHAKLAQIRNQVTAQQDQQRQTRDQLAFTSRVGSQVTQPTVAVESARPYGLVAVSSASPALKSPNIHYCAQPWPDSHPTSGQVAITRNRQVPAPRPRSEFGRGIHPVFR
jgi:hypothetical protein